MASGSTSPHVTPEVFERGNFSFYERNASQYFGSTVAAPLAELYARFLVHIPVHGSILDAGSGSGRDTLAFQRLGYDVDAFDVSPAMAKLSSELTGQPTHVASFDTFASRRKYDGIWACASLLHVHPVKVEPTILRLASMLNPSGVLYASFKHGHGLRLGRDGRWFTDLDENQVLQLTKPSKPLALIDMWLSDSVGGCDVSGRWLNVLFARRPPFAGETRGEMRT